MKRLKKTPILKGFLKKIKKSKKTFDIDKVKS